MRQWTVPLAWPGETVFMIGGGPSVAGQDLRAIAGRGRVIAVNSAGVETCPRAGIVPDYIFSMDGRWLRHHEKALRAGSSAVVTCSSAVRWPGLLLLERRNPPGLTEDRRAVTCQHTSMSGAINLAGHLTGWSGRLVLIGVDGRTDPRGVTHHHTPHPWRSRAGCWDKHRRDFASLAPVLKARGVAVLNASPVSVYRDLWPAMDLPDALAALGFAQDEEPIGHA
jgi:hypothetical protein